MCHVHTAPCNGFALSIEMLQVILVYLMSVLNWEYFTFYRVKVEPYVEENIASKDSKIFVDLRSYLCEVECLRLRESYITI